MAGAVNQLRVVHTASVSASTFVYASAAHGCGLGDVTGGDEEGRTRWRRESHGHGSQHPAS